ncbi:kinase-like protein [Lophium mytilinum]|uniref:Kinase-like protein n=1 Tax=Lophium mytilinum TaxID=390894 RepID=A0A6A6QRB1_9PEZI|nr:kinase-like protein [Lophium mytilinum]
MTSGNAENVPPLTLPPSSHQPLELQLPQPSQSPYWEQPPLLPPPPLPRSQSPEGEQPPLTPPPPLPPSQSAQCSYLPHLIPPPPPRSSRIPRGVRIPNLDYVEDVSKYRRGGLHPVNLGGVLGHKYKVIHKLGYGGFATVWLARVLGEQGYVAVKIPRADSSNKEITILTHLQSVANHLAIANLLDTFTIAGPNGIHNCLVSEAGGPKLGAICRFGKRLPISFVRPAAQQLAACVACLHSAGICHGDLTDNNVLFEIKDLQQWSEAELYQHLGAPKAATLLQFNGDPAPPSAPVEAVSAINYSNFDTGLFSGRTRIVDFGEAFSTSSPPAGLGTAASYFAPEMLFGYPPSLASDVWALGCLIFEMHTSRVFAPAFFGSVEEALGMTHAALGALPEAWQDSWCDKAKPLTSGPGKKHYWFDDQIQRSRPLDSEVRKAMPELSLEELDLLLDLLKGTLAYEPSHRLTAAKVARHAWFTREL